MCWSGEPVRLTWLTTSAVYLSSGYINGERSPAAYLCKSGRSIFTAVAVARCPGPTTCCHRRHLHQSDRRCSSLSTERSPPLHSCSRRLGTWCLIFHTHFCDLKRSTSIVPCFISMRCPGSDCCVRSGRCQSSSGVSRRMESMSGKFSER